MGTTTEDLEQDFSAEEQAFWTMPRLLKFTIFVLFLVVVAVSVLFFQMGHLHRMQTEEVDRVHANRAQTCRIHAALDIPLREDCLEPEVANHYTVPESAPIVGPRSEAHQRMVRLVCFISEAIEDPLECP